jgi:NCS1 family nucleobase:cation symporter-1
MGSWKQGLVLTSVLSFLTFPWMLFSSALFSTFIQFYSAFLGPIVGILLADYWVTRERDTDIESLYNRSDSSKFWFVKGFSVSGIVSMLIGVAVSLPILDLSWIIGLPTAFVAYIVFSKMELNEYTANSLSEDRTRAPGGD